MPAALAGILPVFTSGLDFVDACPYHIPCQDGISEKAGHDDQVCGSISTFSVMGARCAATSSGVV
jgi:hypothetical protein